jgi:hypothetical protein
VKSNVHITVRRDGQLVEHRLGHNIWTDPGREFLAQMLGYASLNPDVPIITNRITQLGFGIGSIKQHIPLIADAPPLSVSYQSGTDPNHTDGHSYDAAIPVEPLITTLERPVRLSGGELPYPGESGDRWLTSTDAYQTMTFVTPTTSTFIFTIYPASGDILYGSFIEVPISEIGLFYSSLSPTGIPYNRLVAYYPFDSILLTSATQLDVQWTVEF